MEHVIAILYHRILESDFTNMYTTKKPDGGGGQSYIQAAGYNREELDDMFCYAKEAFSTIEYWDKEHLYPRKKYLIDAIALGSDISHEMEFAPRTGRADYRISRQNMAHRHPAWHPDNGFPAPCSKIINGKTVYEFEKGYPGKIDNLCIFIILTCDSNGRYRYYAGYNNSPSFPQNWPRGIGLETIFTGTKRKGGIIHFNDTYIRFENNKDNPFLSGSAADEDIAYIDLPKEIDMEAEDAVEYAPKLLSAFDVSDISSVTITSVTPPMKKKHASHSEKMPKADCRTILKTDFTVRQKNLKKIGDLGEKLAIEVERRRLILEGRKDLALQIEHVSVTQGDGLGYDILSYERSDSGDYLEKYIEVKATTGGKNKPFDISINEIRVSDEKGAQYSIYRFYGLHNEIKEAKFYEVRGCVRDNFILEPTAFQAYLK